MKIMRPVLRREEVEIFLRLHGLWEGVVNLPRPPPPPFDIENLQRIEPPWRAIKEWIPDDEPDLDCFNHPRPIQISLTKTGSTRRRHGKHLKIRADSPKNRRQKKSWKSG